MKIIAKIESTQGINNLEELIAYAKEIYDDATVCTASSAMVLSLS